MAEPVRTMQVFFCYACEDEALLNRLKKQLIGHQRQKGFHMWDDRDISPGAEREQEVKKHLSEADLILLLVSPDFLASNSCGVEVEQAMERHERKEARVVPVILRPVSWQEAPFGKLQPLPTVGKPVRDPYWHHEDQAFHDVEDSILAIIEQMHLIRSLQEAYGADNDKVLTAAYEKIQESPHRQPIPLSFEQLLRIRRAQKDLALEKLQRAFSHRSVEEIVAAYDSTLMDAQDLTPDKQRYVELAHPLVEAYQNKDGAKLLTMCAQLWGQGSFSYKREWTPRNPGYIVLLLDQSDRMADHFGPSQARRGRKMCDMLALIVNSFLYELITVNTVSQPNRIAIVKPRVEITVLGYGNGEVSSLLSYTSVKKDTLTLPELQLCPLDVEYRKQKEVDDRGREYETQILFPIWIHPKAAGDAPMCMALRQARALVEQWANNHPECYPPIVIHIVSRMATDGDPTPIVHEIMQLRTNDGEALFFNVYVTTLSDPEIRYPTSEFELPNNRYARLLFDISSPIPETSRRQLESLLGQPVQKGARGMIFNGSLMSLRLMFPIDYSS